MLIDCDSHRLKRRKILHANTGAVDQVVKTTHKAIASIYCSVLDAGEIFEVKTDSLQRARRIFRAEILQTLDGGVSNSGNHVVAFVLQLTASRNSELAQIRERSHYSPVPRRWPARYLYSPR